MSGRLNAFSIGSKISLLASLLVIVTAVCLAFYVSAVAQEEVANHEVSDLKDESNLAGAEVLNDIQQLRSDVWRITPENVATVLAQRPQYLRVQFYDLAESRESPRVSGTTLQSTLQAFDRPAPDAAFFQRLSTGRRHVEFSTIGTAAKRNREESWSEPVLVIDAGILLAETPEGASTTSAVTTSAAPSTKAAVVTMVLDRLSGLSTSARHLMFVADQQGSFLLHPDGAAGSGGVARSVRDESGPLEQGFERLKSLVAKSPSTLEERDEQLEGEQVSDVSLPTHTFYFVASDVLQSSDGAPLEGALAALRAKARELTAAAPGRGLGVTAPPGPRIRLRARGLEEIRRLQQEIVAKNPALRIRWSSDPVPCRDFIVHFDRLSFESTTSLEGEGPSSGAAQYLDLAVAIAREETIFDFTQKLKVLYWGVPLLTLLGVTAAVVLSGLITRPLRRIIESAEKFARDDAEEIVLPVRDKGEVGELARTLDRMIAQVRERGNAVRHLNEDLRTLNEDLDQRVHDRTVQLERINAELGIAIHRANEASRAKSQFIAQMSHEFRTPLTAIIGYSELLIEDVEEPEESASLVSDLQKIAVAGKHLKTLIDDVLDIAKVEAGQLELSHEPIEIGPLTESVITTVTPLAAKNDNRIEAVCPAEIGSLSADLKRLRQVLLNLLSNACKFTHGGLITLRVSPERREDAEGVLFEVEDTGIGIAADKLNLLFQEFYQVDNSTSRKYEGTGLGLAITKRFCELMGGAIAVKSEQGRGSTFSVWLPRAKTEKIPHPAAAPGSAHADESASFTGAVLVIDDDDDARDLMRRHLERDGYRVVTAASGTEGLRLARQLKPAFITLDVMMPNMNGWSVLGDLKSDPALCEIPVVMATIVDDKDLGFALGAAEYLTKPIDRARLAAIVRRFLPTGAKHRSILVVDDDDSTRQLLDRLLAGAGWTVRQAADGREALQAAQAERPALILLDLMMPEMDGFRFLEELRKNSDWRSIPVVVITAKELAAEDRDRLAGGVERIFLKGSYQRKELLQTIREMAAVPTTAAADAK